MDVNGNVNASTFRVSGSTVINSSRRIQPVDGNATNPGYRFASDGNSGLFLPSIGIIGVSTSSTERMRIDASGNVGIGTTSPSSKLSIKGDVSAVVAPADLTLDNAKWFNFGHTSGFGWIGFFTEGNGASAFINTHATMPATLIRHAGTSGGLSFLTASANSGIGDDSSMLERMRINHNGNVGIGTTNPSGPLHVVGGGPGYFDRYLASNTQAPGLILRASRGSFGSQTTILDGDYLGKILIDGYDGTSYLGTAQIHAVANGTIATNSIPTDLVLSTGSSNVIERMRITSSGNVGIGITLPTSDLDVQNSNSTNTFAASFVAIGNDATSTRVTNIENRHTTTVSGSNKVVGLKTNILSSVASGYVESGDQIGHWNAIFRNYNSNGDSGTVNNLYGGFIQYGHHNIDATATPQSTNVYGFYLSPYNRTGTITNLYDIYISNDSSGGTTTNRWAMYQANSIAKNYFAGNVGIGTTSPSTNLHISGATPIARFQDTTSLAPSALSRTMAGLELTSHGMNTTSQYTPAIKFMSTDPDFTTENPKFLAGIVGRATQTYSADTTGGMALDLLVTPVNPGANSVPTTAMTINSNGNVGIGTTSPTYPLDVTGIMRATSYGLFNNIVVGYGDSVYRGNQANGYIGFPTNGNISMMNANVGIGTTSPGTKLHVSGGGLTVNGDPSSAVSGSGSLKVFAGADSSAQNAANFSYSASNNTGVFINLSKSNGTSTSPTVVADGDGVGTIRFQPFDGTALVDSARISTIVNGTVASGSIPVDLRFSTGSSAGGLERMRISSTGNVGIGTSAPSAPLQIFDSTSGSQNMLALNQYGINTARYTTSSNGAVIHLQKSRGDYSAPTIAVNGDELGRISFSGWDGDEFAQGARISAFTSGTVANDDIATRLSFYTTPSGLKTPYTRMTIDSSGNVGIGTTSPLVPFHVAGQIRTNDRVVLAPASGAFLQIYNSATNSFTFGAVSGSDIMTMTSAGNVGIGTASPGSDLAFGGTAPRSIAMERNSTPDTDGQLLTIMGGGATSGATDKNGGGLILSGGTSTGMGSSSIKFQTASPQTSTSVTDNTPTTKMTITGSGYVGVGIQNPTTKVHVYGSSSALYNTLMSSEITPGMGSPESAMRISNNSGTDGSGSYLEFYVKRSDTTNSAAYIGALSSLTGQGAPIVIGQRASSTFKERMRIDTSGYVGIGTTSPDN